MKGKQKFLLLSLILAAILGFVLIIYKPESSIAAQSETLHVIERISFGPQPGELQKVQNQGIKNYIQAQLNPQSLPETPQFTAMLSQLETPESNLLKVYKEWEDRDKLSGADEKKLRVKIHTIVDNAKQEQVLRALDSSHQLQELMTNFWFNHFNVYIGKNAGIKIWIGDYEDKLRANALGNFRDLLNVSAHHPTMLFYLDNWLNTAPNSNGARGRLKGLNENYARELMELHTLGVDGGYSQQDVISLAKILTGWGLAPNNKKNTVTVFYFDSDRHDFSDKIFMGKTIKGTGIKEVETALDMLATNPATARHISFKLAQYFVADQPPKSLVDSLAKTFSTTNGNIREVLNTLFNSSEFLNSQYYDNKFKPPYEYIISLVRASDTDIQKKDLKPMIGMINQLGMPIYGAKTPDGYKNVKDVWLNPEAMIRRVSFATAIGNGSFNKNNQPLDVNKLMNTLGDQFSAHTKETIKNTPEQLGAALILGSPEMMYQ